MLSGVDNIFTIDIIDLKEQILVYDGDGKGHKSLCGISYDNSEACKIRVKIWDMSLSLRGVIAGGHSDWAH
jgi:hypothetical protein